MMKTKKQQKGFALLYTVVIVSLILSITAGISNIIFKQTILSSLATDSQVAFYQADTAVECGMYFLNNVNSGFDFASPENSLACGGTQSYVLNQSESSSTVLVYDPFNATATGPCSSIVFDKSSSTITTIEGHGFNFCNESNPRHIERVLKVTY